MKKVLIITYYWPPAGGSGVQRWLKFVKYLGDFGIEPIVYTIKNKNYPIVDKSLAEEIPKHVKVLQKPIFEPNTIFSIFGKNKGESAGFLNPNPTFFGRIMQYIRANFFIPDARKFWIKPSVNYLTTYLKTHKIDVVITTGPPHSMHLIGQKLKQRLHIKWIADFRDPWTEIDYFHQLPLTKKAIKKHYKLEKEVLQQADSVLVVSNTMKASYRKISPNVTVIPNGFDIEISDDETTLDTKFSITHVGLMNADRNPKILWEVLDEIVHEDLNFKNDFELRLIGKVDASILAEVKKHEISENITVINYVSHKEVIQYQKQSQVLLIAVNNVPSAKGIVTGKIFEYLLANRPILAIAPTDGDLAKIIQETKSGITIGFSAKETLKNTILDFYSKYKQEKLEVNLENIAQYHRKELTERLSEIINSI